jgi:hypothetical protein
MKQLKHITAAIILASFLVACYSDTYPGVDYDYGAGDEASNNEKGKTSNKGVPLRVFVKEQSLYTALAINSNASAGASRVTRGTGPFDIPDTTNHYHKSVFRLFGFRDRPDDQGPLDYVPDLRMRSTNTEDIDRNCIIDGRNFTEGMPAHLMKDHSGEFQMVREDLKTDTALYYAARYNDIGYNFFAYHIDDAAIVNAQRESDRIYYDIDIDGTQNIMVGHTERLTPEQLDSRHSNIHLSQAQRDKVLNIGNYSSYSSQLGIHPIIDMKHQLARFEFRAYPADSSCNDIFIDSIGLYAKNRGRLVVAASNMREVGMSFEDRRDTLWLKGPNPFKTDPDSIGIYPYESLKAENNTVNWEDGMSRERWTDNPYKRIGGDLLVPPDTKFVMTIHYKQFLRNADKGLHTYKSRFVITPPTSVDSNYDEETSSWWFKKGNRYVVRIAVYGLPKIKVYIDQLDPWVEDPDEIEYDLEELEQM